MAAVELKNVSKSFRGINREEIYAVNDVSLAVANGEFLAIVGPSGCGKTTTLRMIAGLETPSAGTISIGGIAMNEVEPKDRDVAMVFQTDALYPHLTVFENIALPLKLRNVPADGDARVREMAAMLGLTQYLDRFPKTLSGGQRQRVAIARAIVRRPKVFLFDEPLSDLDASLRLQMRTELARLHARLNATIIHVTHDQAEAMTLGQRIAVMRNGAIEQVADPLTLYQKPANMFVAGFVGSPPMNLFRGRVVATPGGFVFQEHNPAGAANGLRLQLPLPPERGERLSRFAEGNVVLGLRPENIALAEDGESNVAATVELVEMLGADAHLHLTTGAHSFVVRVPARARGAKGERVRLRSDVSNAFYFNPVSEVAIT